MTSKFLSTVGSNANLSNGSADLYVNSIGIAGLTQTGKPLTLSASKHVQAGNIGQDAVTNLQNDLSIKNELSYTKSDAHSNPPAGQVKTYFKTDGDFYKKDDAGTETKVAGSGVGDVVGPAVSVDNTIPRFDATTGKLIQGSGVTIDDSNNITTNGYIAATSGGITGTLSTNTVQPITTNTFDLGATALRYNTIYANNFINGVNQNLDVSSEVSSNAVNQIVTFSATNTTGKVIKNCGLTVDASNNLTGANNVTATGLTTTQNLDVNNQINSGNINNVGTITTQGVRFVADNAVDIGEVAKQCKDFYIKGDIKYNKPSQNIFLGIDSGGISLSTGNNNIGIGKNTLPSVTSGTYNVCLAELAGRDINTGLSNVLLGYNSGSLINSGGGNICIGSSSGGNLTTGNNNIHIGTTSVGANGLNNSIILGSGVTNTANNSCVIGDNNIQYIKPSSQRGCDLGTTTQNFKDIYGDKIILNTQAQSNKYYNKNGTAGIDIGNTATGGVNLTGSKYQGKNNQLVTLNGSGQIQQPSPNAVIDGNGNATFKNLDLLNIASSGVIKCKKIQSNDAANNLELFNRATVNGVGIVVDNTTSGFVNLTGAAYFGGLNNRIFTVDTTGKLQLSNATIDGPGNLTASNTTLDSLTLKNNLNFDIDNSHDVGTVASAVRNIYYKTNLSGNTATFTGQINSNAIIPQVNNTSDLGSSTQAYKNLYLSATASMTNLLATTAYTPNIFLGTFGGGTGSTGGLNCNSGNITNTGDIFPLTDNTEDIGSTGLTYKNIYIKGDVFKNGTPIGAGGSGDVVGPSSSTDNRIVLFNGSTGKLIKQSGLTVSTVGAVNDVLSVPGGVDGKLFSTTQAFFSGNTGYTFEYRNSNQLDSGIQIYGCNTSAASGLNFASGAGNAEASGYGVDTVNDAFTIFCPGDNGASLCNFQDEDSSNTRVAYVNTSGTLVAVSSQKRKNRIKDKSNNKVLERFKQLKVKSYGYNQPDEEKDFSDKKKKRLKKKREKMHIGLILEELFTIFPNACDGYYNKMDRKTRKKNLDIEKEIKNPENSGIDYTKLQLYHIMAFQDYIRNTDAKIIELEEKLNSLVK